MRRVPKDSKIAVAMSGGVDSGVAAALLVGQGYKVIGLFMRHLEGVEDQEGAARQVADCLDIPLDIVDLRRGFNEEVIDYFLSEYRVGRTPNPCIVCNKRIKFGRLLDYARELGCDHLATGHYARLRREVSPAEEKNPNSPGPGPGPFPSDFGESAGQYRLLMARDRSKDQSYFLWQLSQEQLEHILFPIGGLTKDEVRKFAKEKKLPVAERPESFEICFIPDSVERFLRCQIPEAIQPGPVVNVKGETVGKHRGLPLYTYGQRRGLELNKYQGIPLYVVGIAKDRNALIVGRGKESEVSEFEVEDVNWIWFRPAEEKSSALGPQGSNSPGPGPGKKRTWSFSFEPLEPNSGESADPRFKCEVRIRHQGELMPATVELLSDNEAQVVLDEPTRAVTPGQSAVFYRGEELLGGGVISNRV